MFNIAVFKLKDIIKYMIYITLTTVIAISSVKYFTNKGEIKKETVETKEEIIDSQKEKKEENEKKEKTEKKEEKKKNIISKINTKNIDRQIVSLKKINEDKNRNKKKEVKTENSKKLGYMKKIINTEISSINEIKKEEVEREKEREKEKENKKAEIEKNKKEEINGKSEKEEVQLASTQVKTEIITNNPIKEVYNTTYGKVKIKNGTNINLTEEIMKPDIKIDNKNILIFHTHTCESYTPSKKYPYEQTGNYRTTNLNYSVARLGDELEKHLKEYKIPVIHDKTYHDYPAYNGSYTRSLKTVQNILKENKSDIIIDIHRDAIGAREDYAPIVKIGDEIAAQIMYVIGTNEGGLEHPNWEQNLKFAIKVQEKAEEMYPGLFKPIMLSKYRYNQHNRKTCKHNGSRSNRKHIRTINNKYEISSKSIRRSAKIK